MQNILSQNRAWNFIYFYAPIPDGARPDDLLKVYVVNEHGSGCFVDNLQADRMVFKPAW